MAQAQAGGIRARWLPAANLVVLGWLGAAALTVAAVRPLAWPVWVPVHMFLLGAVSSAILIWSEHFAVAVLHARQEDRWLATTRLATLNVGAALVVAGRVAGWPAVLGAGAVIVLIAVGWHAAMLWRLSKRGLGGVLAGVVHYYLAAAAALFLGGALGAALGTGRLPEPWHGRLLAAHLHLNVLGWVLLTVLGTLFMLWPVLLRTGMAPSTRWALRWCLRLTGGGLAVAVAGLLVGSRVLAAAGLAAYVGGVVVAARPLLAATRGQRPRSGAGWMVGASVCWLAGAVTADALVVATTPDPGALVGRLAAIGPVLMVGVIAQVLIGSLVHLLPVSAGGGPPAVRAAAAVMEQGWPLRLAALNAAVLLVSLPFLPGLAATTGWLLAGLVVVDVVGRGIWLAASRHIARNPERRRKGAAVAAGVGAGVLVTAVALVFAGGGAGPDTQSVGGGGVQEVEVRLAGMRVLPSQLIVAAGTQLRLRIVNEDTQPHDLRLATGGRTPLLHRGEQATLDIGEITNEINGWCTVAGHRAAGMTLRIVPGSEAAPTMLGHGHAAGVAFGAGFTPYPANLAAPDGATVHRLTLPVVEKELEVAPGVRQRMWTFGGTVPGPTLRGRVGDVFEVTLVNSGSLGHGIDFHASALAPDGPMRVLAPGEQLLYRFQAVRAGAWLYHCSNAPLMQHVGNGMFGAVIIDPPDLPTVDREYVLVGNELYLGEPGSAQQVAKMRSGAPDAWAFNGAAHGYAQATLPGRVGERVRVWVVAAGPSDGVAFHVVGAQFDTVYREGDWVLRPGAGAAQVLDLAVAQGGFVELSFPEPGRYPFVDHDLRHADNGAAGAFTVEG